MRRKINEHAVERQWKTQEIKRLRKDENSPLFRSFLQFHWLYWLQSVWYIVLQLKWISFIIRSLIHKVTIWSICHYWYELYELLIKFLKELKDAVAPASATSLRRICARPRRSSFSKASSNTSHTASSTWDALSGKRLAMAYLLWTSLNHVNKC